MMQSRSSLSGQFGSIFGKKKMLTRSEKSPFLNFPDVFVVLQFHSTASWEDMAVEDRRRPIDLHSHLKSQAHARSSYKI